MIASATRTSLPGYAFSGKPTTPGWDIEKIAAAWAALMSRLGYTWYGAQGSDWGTSISTLLAQHDPDHVAGIHLTPPLAPPDPATFDDLTEPERSALASLQRSAEWESGYSKEHSTPAPQTIGYGLVDSPAGLCAWIIEKFWAWTDHDGGLEHVLTRDELLDNLMLYWPPRTRASAARLYWESIRQVNLWISGQASDTIGCSVSPKNSSVPPADGRSGASPTSATGTSPRTGLQSDPYLRKNSSDRSVTYSFCA